MFYLSINKKQYKIEDSFQFKKSNNEVTFQDVTVDFSEGTIADIPYKYQEVKICNDNDEVVFTRICRYSSNVRNEKLC